MMRFCENLRMIVGQLTPLQVLENFCSSERILCPNEDCKSSYYLHDKKISFFAEHAD